MPTTSTKTSRTSYLVAVPDGPSGSPARTAAEIRLWEALVEHPDASASDLARHAAVGRSTAAKILARWDENRSVTRTTGETTGGRRHPDTWSVLSENEPPATDAADSPCGGTTTRLPKGALRGLVEDFFRDPDRLGNEYTPGDIARKLGRSSGAVSNALDRLAEHGTVAQTSDRPRRFRLSEDAARG